MCAPLVQHIYCVLCCEIYQSITDMNSSCVNASSKNCMLNNNCGASYTLLARDTNTEPILKPKRYVKKKLHNVYMHTHIYIWSMYITKLHPTHNVRKHNL